jgi:hypothetical protein
MLGQNDASLRPDLPAFERFDACERRSGPKTLDRQANLGDLGVKWHATWGMSVKITGQGYLIFSENHLQFSCLTEPML